MPLPLWIWLEYPVIPRYLQLNLLAIQHHAGNDFELKLLNRSTLGSLLDLPPEFARVPYAVAASDFARIGLLAMYGGLYMDADFLVARPLAPLATLLERYDVVSSSDAGDESCARGWSPNFVAARPRTPLWMEAWTSLTNQLKRRCGPPARHKICFRVCFERPVKIAPSLLWHGSLSTYTTVDAVPPQRGNLVNQSCQKGIAFQSWDKFSSFLHGRGHETEQLRSFKLAAPSHSLDAATVITSMSVFRLPQERPLRGHDILVAIDLPETLAMTAIKPGCSSSAPERACPSPVAS